MKVRSSVAILALAAMFAPAIVLGGPASAAGTNQYGSGFPISSSGFCHGAFANTNGSFGSLGTGGQASSIGGGVPVFGSAGWNNSAVSGDCILPN